MSTPETHTCHTCGYQWSHGLSGDHRCADYLSKTVADLRAELAALTKERDALKEQVDELMPETDFSNAQNLRLMEAQYEILLDQSHSLQQQVEALREAWELARTFVYSAAKESFDAETAMKAMDAALAQKGETLQ